MPGQNEEGAGFPAGHAGASAIAVAGQPAGAVERRGTGEDLLPECVTCVPRRIRYLCPGSFNPILKSKIITKSKSVLFIRQRASLYQ